MTREIRWTYALLVGCVLMILVSAYVLITQGEDLRKARANLDAINADVAQKQAQLLVLSDAIVANQDQAEVVSGAIQNVTRNCSDQEALTPQMRAVCAVSVWASGPSMKFVPSYTQVAMQRTSAQSDDEWAKVRKGYEGLSAILPDEASGHDAWAARVEEGIAYSDYRMGRLAEARKRADNAARLDKQSAFVALTRLKIACAQRSPAADVERLYAEHKSALDGALSKASDDTAKRYANLELGYFAEDPEAALACSYAKLPFKK